jgi:SAM-dependent methyltransferase
MTKKTPTAPQTCYLCGGQQHDRVDGKVRDMPALGILKCAACGLVFLDNFDHVREDYYDRVYPKGHHEPESWDEFLVECRPDDLRRAEQIRPLLDNRRFLDVGCGAGGLLMEVARHCREASGVEPQSRWTQLLKDKGYTVHPSLTDVRNQSADVIGLFHVLEHIADPIALLKETVKKAAPGGRIVVEVPNANDALLSLYNSKPYSEFVYWSPHLYLFTATTLGRLFERAGLKDFQVQQYQRYPLSNHLYWLSRGLPRGHQLWRFLDSPVLNQSYAMTLGTLGVCDTLMAHINVPA